MATIGSKYYIKAKEAYPYDLEEAVESLDYALSYDDEHAGTHCLYGRYYAEQEYNPQAAFYHFERALVLDINYIETYYYYTVTLVQYAEYERAKKLIAHALKVPGICLGCMYGHKATMLEKQGKFNKAIQALEDGILHSLHNNEIEHLKSTIKRIKDKKKRSSKK